MKINELKVGDRVKYYTPQWMFKYNKELTATMEGIISEKDNNNFYMGVLIVPKENIISKLESLPPQYKEIKIEHKPDYYHKIYDGYDYLQDEQNSNKPRQQCNACKKFVYQINGDVCDECINKKEEYSYVVCRKCGSNSYPYKIRKTDICNHCEDKEKSTPKSFICEYVPIEWEMNKRWDTFEYKTKGYCNGSDGITNLFFEGLLAPEWLKVGKTYTIEIKEKE